MQLTWTCTGSHLVPTVQNERSGRKRNSELAVIATTVVVYNEADISPVPSLDNWCSKFADDGKHRQWQSKSLRSPRIRGLSAGVYNYPRKATGNICNYRPNWTEVLEHNLPAYNAEVQVSEQLEQEPHQDMRKRTWTFFYDDIVHALENTIDTCINSATDRFPATQVYQIQWNNAM